MTTAEMQERRNALAADIRDQADKFKSNGNKWPNNADKAKWDRLNSDYDSVVAKMDSERDAGVLDRAAAVDRMQNSPVPSPFAGPGRGNETTELGRRMRGQQSQNSEFVNASTGRPIPVLKAGQRYADVMPTPTEFAGGAVPRIGEVIASKLLGRPFGNVSEGQYMASLTGVDSQGGFAITPSLWPQMIDLLRSSSVVMQAGAQQAFLDGPEVRIVRLTSDVSANWRAEGELIPTSEAAFGSFTLRPRTVAALSIMSLEMAEGVQNLVNMIERSMQSAVGQAIDRAILMGSGAGQEPVGVLNDAGINTVSSVGTPASYGHVSDAVGKVLTANYSGPVSDLSWIQHPRDAITLDKLVDGQNQPMMPTPWASQLQRFHTTSLPTDGGAGDDESQAVVGHFPSILVGQLGGVRFQTFDSGSYHDANGKLHSLVSEYSRALRMIVRLDAVALQPSLFTKLEGITAAA